MRENQTKKQDHISADSSAHSDTSDTLGRNIMLRDLMPTDKVCGYEVRPGYYQVDGATPVRGGVNFTISSVYEPLASCFF